MCQTHDKVSANGGFIVKPIDLCDWRIMWLLSDETNIKSVRWFQVWWLGLCLCLCVYVYVCICECDRQREKTDLSKLTKLWGGQPEIKDSVLAKVSPNKLSEQKWPIEKSIRGQRYRGNY